MRRAGVPLSRVTRLQRFPDGCRKEDLSTLPQQPRRPEAHRIAQLAEQSFATFVTRHGSIWHGVSAGSDYGIDGRVELVEEDSPIGVEFAVQVKARALQSASRHGVLSAGDLRVSTARYWRTRLTPTLVVVFDTTTEALYAEWAHLISGLPEATAARRRRSIKLRFPATAQLTGARWRALSEDAKRFHERMTGAFSRDPVRELVGLLYVQLSDAADLLLDWVFLMAYGSVRMSDEGTGMVVDRPVAQKFAGGPRFLMNGFIRPLAVTAQCAALSAAGLARSLRELLSADHPVVEAVEALHLRLWELLDSMYVGDPPQQCDSETAFVDRDLDGSQVATALGAILLVLRDFNREIRPYLFPWQLGLLANVRPDTREERLTRLLADLPSMLVTPLEEWSASPADHRG
jgi:hypothetical protein